jgi:hypothetical protein
MLKAMETEESPSRANDEDTASEASESEGDVFDGPTSEDTSPDNSDAESASDNDAEDPGQLVASALEETGTVLHEGSADATEEEEEEEDAAEEEEEEGGATEEEETVEEAEVTEEGDSGESEYLSEELSEEVGVSAECDEAYDDADSREDEAEEYEEDCGDVDAESEDVDAESEDVDAESEDVDAESEDVDAESEAVDVDNEDSDVDNENEDYGVDNKDKDHDAEVEAGEAEVEAHKAEVEAHKAEVDVDEAEIEADEAEVEAHKAEVDVDDSEADVDEAAGGSGYEYEHGEEAISNTNGVAGGDSERIDGAGILSDVHEEADKAGPSCKRSESTYDEHEPVTVQEEDTTPVIGSDTSETAARWHKDEEVKDRPRLSYPFLSFVEESSDVDASNSATTADPIGLSPSELQRAADYMVSSAVASGHAGSASMALLPVGGEEDDDVASGYDEAFRPLRGSLAGPSSNEILDVEAVPCRHVVSVDEEDSAPEDDAWAMGDVHQGSPSALGDAGEDGEIEGDTAAATAEADAVPVALESPFEDEGAGCEVTGATSAAAAADSDLTNAADFAREDADLAMNLDGGSGRVLYTLAEEQSAHSGDEEVAAEDAPVDAPFTTMKSVADSKEGAAVPPLDAAVEVEKEELPMSTAGGPDPAVLVDLLDLPASDYVPVATDDIAQAAEGTPGDQAAGLQLSESGVAVSAQGPTDTRAEMPPAASIHKDVPSLDASEETPLDRSSPALAGRDAATAIETAIEDGVAVQDSSSAADHGTNTEQRVSAARGTKKKKGVLRSMSSESAQSPLSGTRCAPKADAGQHTPATSALRSTAKAKSSPTLSSARSSKPARDTGVAQRRPGVASAKATVPPRPSKTTAKAVDSSRSRATAKPPASSTTRQTGTKVAGRTEVGFGRSIRRKETPLTDSKAAPSAKGGLRTAKPVGSRRPPASGGRGGTSKGTLPAQPRALSGAPARSAPGVEDVQLAKVSKRKPSSTEGRSSSGGHSLASAQRRLARMLVATDELTPLKTLPPVERPAGLVTLRSIMDVSLTILAL